MELGIRLSFVQTSEFWGGGGSLTPQHPTPSVRHWQIWLCCCEDNNYRNVISDITNAKLQRAYHSK
jgi:hypothetical protein